MSCRNDATVTIDAGAESANVVTAGKRPRHRTPPRGLGVAAGASGKALARLLKDLTRRINKKDARARL